MDAITGLFDDFLRLLTIICFEIPAVIAVIVAAITGLVKWNGYDSYEKKRFLWCFSLLIALVAAAHWYIRSPIFMKFSMLGELVTLSIFAIVAFAGWLYYQIAITGFAMRIDESMDNLREIARNSRDKRL